MLVSPRSQIEGVILMILLQALTVRVSGDPFSTCTLDQDGSLDWTSKYVLGKRCWTLSCTPRTPHSPPGLSVRNLVSLIPTVAYLLTPFPNLMVHSLLLPLN